MPDASVPIAAKNIDALRSLGAVHLVQCPPTVAHVVTHTGGNDSIWIDLSFPVHRCAELWRSIHPNGLVGGERDVRPLATEGEVRRAGLTLVRVGLIGAGSSDGQYVLTSLQHDAPTGQSSSDGRFLYRR